MILGLTEEEGLADRLALGEILAETEAERLGLILALGEMLALTLADCDGEILGLRLALGLTEAETLAESEALTLALGLALRLADRLALALGLTLAETEALGLTLAEGLALRLALNDADMEEPSAVVIEQLHTAVLAKSTTTSWNSYSCKPCAPEPKPSAHCTSQYFVLAMLSRWQRLSPSFSTLSSMGVQHSAETATAPPSTSEVAVPQHISVSAPTSANSPPCLRHWSLKSESGLTESAYPKVARTNSLALSQPVTSASQTSTHPLTSRSAYPILESVCAIMLLVTGGAIYSVCFSSSLQALAIF